MYRVRYLEQNDKMSQQVRLRMVEEVYPPELLEACVQQCPKCGFCWRWCSGADWRKGACGIN